MGLEALGWGSWSKRPPGTQPEATGSPWTRSGRQQPCPGLGRGSLPGPRPPVAPGERDRLTVPPPPASPRSMRLRVGPAHSPGPRRPCAAPSQPWTLVPDSLLQDGPAHTQGHRARGQSLTHGPRGGWRDQLSQGFTHVLGSTYRGRCPRCRGCRGVPTGKSGVSAVGPRPAEPVPPETPRAGVPLAGLRAWELGPVAQGWAGP